MRAQPLDELDHVGVAPHPRGEAPEVGERFYGIDIVAHAAHVAVDAVGVGPIGLDRDGREAFLLDEPLRDLGALAVELVRAVGRLAEQHEARVADQVHERVVVWAAPVSGCAISRTASISVASVVLGVASLSSGVVAARAGRGPLRPSSVRSPRTRGRPRRTAPA